MHLDSRTCLQPHPVLLTTDRVPQWRRVRISEKNGLSRSNDSNLETEIDVMDPTGKMQRPKNLGSRVALLPGISLVRPEIFCAYERKTWYAVQIFPDHFLFSRWFQNDPDFSGSQFPDRVTTIQISPDNFLISGQFHNCPDFPTSYPIFRTVSKPLLCILLSCIFLSCIALYCILLSAMRCIVLYCIIVQEHWIRILWQCRESQSRAF